MREKEGEELTYPRERRDNLLLLDEWGDNCGTVNEWRCEHVGSGDVGGGGNQWAGGNQWS